MIAQPVGPLVTGSTAPERQLAHDGAARNTWDGANCSGCTGRPIALDAPNSPTFCADWSAEFGEVHTGPLAGLRRSACPVAARIGRRRSTTGIGWLRGGDATHRSAPGVRRR